VASAITILRFYINGKNGVNPQEFNNALASELGNRSEKPSIRAY
jgi:hypothetical protein